MVRYNFRSMTCCATIVMSPFLQDRNVPLIRPLKGGQIEADGDEPGGVETSRSAGPGAQRAAAGGRCEPADGSQLPASEAFVEALSQRRSRGTEASQRG